MYCKFCGKEIDDNSSFCPSCGEKLENIGEVAGALGAAAAGYQIGKALASIGSYEENRDSIKDLYKGLDDAFGKY